MAVLITLAFGIPFILRAGADHERLLVWAFWVTWPTLLFTSIALFWFERRALAVVGLVSALLSGVIACLPVLVE
jgi:hypothetical protein